MCLLAPRGVSIALSHYCPTAAALLFSAGRPAAIVGDAFPPAAHYEGLDARVGPPPPLRPGVWLGWDGHERWERHAVETLGRGLAPEVALDRLAGQAEAVRAWTLERGPFLPFLDRAIGKPGDPGPQGPSDEALVATVLAAVPEALRPSIAAAPAVGLDAFAGPVGRYLAARAFASWIGVQGPGLRTLVVSLRAALAVLRRQAAAVAAEAGGPLDRDLMIQAFRRSDLLLLHLASPEALASGLGRFEAGRP